MPVGQANRRTFIAGLGGRPAIPGQRGYSQKPRRPIRQHVAERLDHDIGQQGANLIGSSNIRLNKNLIVDGQHGQHITRPVVIALEQEPHRSVHDVRCATLHRIVHRIGMS